MEIQLLLFGKEREIGFGHLVPRPRNYSEQLTRVDYLKGTLHTKFDDGRVDRKILSIFRTTRPEKKPKKRSGRVVWQSRRANPLKQKIK
jgi:hypothetical protein